MTKIHVLQNNWSASVIRYMAMDFIPTNRTNSAVSLRCNAARILVDEITRLTPEAIMTSGFVWRSSFRTGELSADVLVVVAIWAAVSVGADRSTNTTKTRRSQLGSRKIIGRVCFGIPLVTSSPETKP